MARAERDAVAAGRTRVFAVATGLLAIWGLALWLYNSLFFKFAHFFALGAVQISWTLTAFHVAYMLVAIPAVVFHRKFGFKLGFLTGLSVFGIGAFLLYLAIIQHSSLFFFGAVVVIGSCGAWLDTSLNPLVAMAGSPRTLVRRMNVAHAFNGAGLFVAYVTGISLLGKDYVLASGLTAQVSARPYVLVGLGAILLAFLVEQVALPDFAAKGRGKATEQASRLRDDVSALLSDKSFLIAAAALGAYCAVLTILWTTNYKFLHLELPGHSAPILERGWFWFVMGRLTGTVLMRWIDPVRLLQLCAALCLVAIAVTAAAGGSLGWVTLLAASFLLSITYPTVFGIALGRSPAQIAVAAGLLVIAAGFGNALSSLLGSLALDAFGVSPRLVILAALPLEGVVLYFALRSRSRRVLPQDAAAV